MTDSSTFAVDQPSRDLLYYKQFLEKIPLKLENENLSYFFETLRTGITYSWSTLRNEVIQCVFSKGLDPLFLQAIYRDIWESTIVPFNAEDSISSKEQPVPSWQSLTGALEFCSKYVMNVNDDIESVSQPSFEYVVKFVLERDERLLGHPIPEVRESVVCLLTQCIAKLEKRNRKGEWGYQALFMWCVERLRSSSLRYVSSFLLESYLLLASFLVPHVNHIDSSLIHEADIVDLYQELMEPIHAHEASSVRQRISDVYESLAKNISIEQAGRLVQSLIGFIQKDPCLTEDRSVNNKASEETILLSLSSILPHLTKEHLKDMALQSSCSLQSVPALHLAEIPVLFLFYLSELTCVTTPPGSELLSPSPNVTPFELTRAANELLPLIMMYSILQQRGNSTSFISFLSEHQVTQPRAVYRLIYEFLSAYILAKETAAISVTPILDSENSTILYHELLPLSYYIDISSMSEPLPFEIPWFIACVLLSFAHRLLALKAPTLRIINFTAVSQYVPLEHVVQLVPDLARQLHRMLFEEGEEKDEARQSGRWKHESCVQFIELCCTYLTSAKSERKTQHTLEIYYVLPVMEAIATVMDLCHPPRFLSYCPRDVLFSRPNLSDREPWIIPNPDAATYALSHPILTQREIPPSLEILQRSLFLSHDFLSSHHCDRVVRALDTLCIYAVLQGIELPILRFALFLGSVSVKLRSKSSTPASKDHRWHTHVSQLVADSQMQKNFEILETSLNPFDLSSDEEDAPATSTLHQEDLLSSDTCLYSRSSITACIQSFMRYCAHVQHQE